MLLLASLLQAVIVARIYTAVIMEANVLLRVFFVTILPRCILLYENRHCYHKGNYIFILLCRMYQTAPIRVMIREHFPLRFREHFLLHFQFR